MNYQEIAAGLNEDQVAGLLRALDQIAHVDLKARPGHVAYATKQGLVDIASMAISEVYQPSL